MNVWVTSKQLTFHFLSLENFVSIQNTFSNAKVIFHDELKHLII